LILYTSHFIAIEKNCTNA